MSPYIAVFEHTQESLGETGVRFSNLYQNEGVFLNTFDDHNGQIKAIAGGVSAARASDLVAQTPEICRLTAAVQRLCNQDGSISDMQSASFHVNQAIHQIEEDRKQRQANNLVPLLDFPFVQIPDDLSDRSELFRFIKYTFDSPDGRVDNKTGLVYSSLMEMIKSLYCVPDLSSTVSDKKKNKTKKKKSIPLT